jgi:hypothetical protein
VHASAAVVVACVAVAAVAVAADVVTLAVGVALGAVAVAPAHPAMKTERTAAAKIRMRDIMQAEALRAL